MRDFAKIKADLNWLDNYLTRIADRTVSTNPTVEGDNAIRSLEKFAGIYKYCIDLKWRMKMINHDFPEDDEEDGVFDD